MINPQQDIDLSILSSEEFEGLCFEIIWRNGFQNVKWRGGTDDQGRDIDAVLEVNKPIVGKVAERWHFECKKYVESVPKTVLTDKIAWADANTPDILVFLISSQLSNQTRDWLAKISKKKSYKIYAIEGVELKRVVANEPDLIRKYFNKGNLAFLRSLMKNWLIFESEPSTQELKNLLVNSDFTKMNNGEIIYLMCASFIAQNRIFESDTGVEKFEFDTIVQELSKRVGKRTKQIIHKNEQISITPISEHYFYANKKQFHFSVSHFLILKDEDFFSGLHCVIGDGEWWAHRPIEDYIDSGYELLLFENSDFETRMRRIKTKAESYLRKLEKQKISFTK